MCLIAMALDKHPEYPFILISNRDEFYNRPTSQAGFWLDKPHILGGRDNEGMGTWMAMTQSGRFSAVTNCLFSYFDPNAPKKRGELPVEFLESNISPTEFSHSIKPEGSKYNGFNILTYSYHGKEAAHFDNFKNHVNKLKSPGIYCICNGILDSAWPRVKRLKTKFKKLLKGVSIHPEQFFDLLSDEYPNHDNIPQCTWIPYDVMKSLSSSIFIRNDEFGTCSSTVIWMDRDGNVDFWEKTYVKDGAKKESIRHFRFQIEQEESI